MKLSPKSRINSCSRFVSGPQVVSERLNDVIGCHADVRGAVRHHFCDHSQQSQHSAEFRIGFLKATNAVEMAEKLVSAVDQMDDHFSRIILAKKKIKLSICPLVVRLEGEEPKWQIN